MAEKSKEEKKNAIEAPAKAVKAAKKEAKKSVKEKKVAQKKESIASDAKAVSDAFDVIRFVLMTEKSIRMVESQNKLVFIVNRSSKKGQIRKSIENAFCPPISGITTVIDQSGRKKAFVKFSNPGAAGDIAIKLGVI